MNQIELTQAVISHWNTDNASIEHIQTGVDGNQTYRVTNDSSQVILRVYGERGRVHHDVLYELQLLVHLAGAGVPVAAPIAARDGSLFKTLDSHSAALFEFADGGVEWPTAPHLASLLGASFAEMHRSANSFSAVEYPSLDTESLLLSPLDMMCSYLDDSDDDGDRDALTILSDTAFYCANLLEAIPNTPGAIGPIHGDLHQGNCHFHGDQLKIFDFSNAAVGWRVYDLSGFLWPYRDHTILDPSIRATCDSFLEGYNKIRPLLPEEHLAVKASVKARDFWEMGNWLRYGDNLDGDEVRSHLRCLADRFSKHPLSTN